MKRNFTSPENQDNKQSKMSSSPQFDTTSITTDASDVIGLQLQQSLLSSNLINEMTKMIITSKSFTDAIAGIIDNQLKQYVNHIKQLEAELKQVNDRAIKFQSKLNDLDQYSKRRDLIIHGIPLTQGEDTSQVVLDLAKSIGVNLDIKDLYATHRLRSRNKQHSPIIAAFVRYSDRQQLYSKRRDLGKGTNKQVFINEHLSSLNHQLFTYARRHLDKKKVFTRNGSVMLYQGQDFNAHYQGWSRNDVVSTAEGMMLNTFLQSHNLSQLVVGVTRPSSDKSDHSFIQFDVKTQILRKTKMTRTIYDYKTANWELLNNICSKIPFDTLLRNYTNIDEKAVAVEEILLEQVNRVIPHKVITLKPRDKIWFSDDLRVLHKDKVRMYRKMISKPTLVNKNNYEQAVVKFRKACVQAKVEFYKKINHKVSVSSKNWWSLVKHTMGRDRTTAIPALKDKNGDVRVDVQSKVEILNAHFANICTWSGYSNFSSVADKLPPASSRLSVFTATYRDVRKILQRLNSNKSTAPTITNRMLRYLEPSITQCLTHLIRASFSTTSFPDHWKGGYVNALFKSGDSLDPTNYRPITLLPAISK
ncbi:unnamed protein product, partial [Didymodactylos carnosus]